MANINFPADGQGTQALKKLNQANSLIADVDAVTPDPDSQKKSSRNKTPFQLEGADAHQPDENPESPASEPAVTPHQYVSRSNDRRQHNRRQKNERVLLNTRSEHERRKQTGQRQQDQVKPETATDPLSPVPPLGIDTEA